MEFTHDQELALMECISRYYEGEPYTCIAGYAGTGKTFITKYLIDLLELDPESDVCYVGPTGKSAQVLRQKGNPNVKTIHKLIYESKLQKNGRYTNTLRRRLEEPYKLLIVDECSMVDEDTWNKLLSFKIPIVACGDPGQLPQISKEKGRPPFNLLARPHVFMREIVRQALDNEIIRLSMWIREGKPLASYKGFDKDVKILGRSDLTQGVYLWADQILCGLNRTRHAVNTLVRDLHQLPPEPTIGDKVISVHNQWDILSNDIYQYPLINGTIGYITDFHCEYYQYPKKIMQDPIEIMWADIKGEMGEVYNNVPIDYQSLLNEKPQINGETLYKILQLKKIVPEIVVPCEFNYGNCLTTWKAQGSQWDNVLVLEENFPFEREEKAKFLYTSLTRAAKRCVIVKR